MKNYSKSTWEDRIVQYPNRYKDQNGNLLILTQEPGTVFKAGTFVEAVRMNNIENAIEYLFQNRTFGYQKVLLVDNWLFNEESGFYEYDIEDSNVTENTMVDGILDIENQYKLSASHTESYNGGFKVVTVDEVSEDIEITFKYSLINIVGDDNL